MPSQIKYFTTANLDLAYSFYAASCASFLMYSTFWAHYVQHILESAHPSEANFSLASYPLLSQGIAMEGAAPNEALGHQP